MEAGTEGEVKCHPNQHFCQFRNFGKLAIFEWPDKNAGRLEQKNKNKKLHFKTLSNVGQKRFNVVDLMVTGKAA